MNRYQFLLQLLQEEAAEVIQEASKCNRFGLDERMDDDTPPNRVRLQREVQDLFAVLLLLSEEFGLDFEPDESHINNKFAKIKHYYQYTLSLGLTK